MLKIGVLNVQRCNTNELSLEDNGIIVTKGIFSKQECDILRLSTVKNNKDKCRRKRHNFKNKVFLKLI